MLDMDERLRQVVVRGHLVVDAAEQVAGRVLINAARADRCISCLLYTSRCV